MGWGVYESGEGNGKFSLQATWIRGGRILSQQGGFQVSKEGANGEQKGMEKSKKQGEYSKFIVACIRVMMETEATREPDEERPKRRSLSMKDLRRK